METAAAVAENAPDGIARPVPIPHDRIDPDALKVIHRLSRHGHLAYLVGGCVRDLLVGFRPKDFDIATSAWPGEIRDLFRNCRIIGRRFRLAHILFSGKFIEVSTFRGNAAEADPAEGEDLLIKEDNVFGSPEEDARRRDFTANALFYDVEGDEIIDYVGGLDDVRGRVLRCIGDPQIRFREDPLRILRAYRFGSRLNFAIEPDVMKAMADTKDDLVKSAPPRVHEELLKMLACGAASRAFAGLHQSGVLDVLMKPVSDAIPTVRTLLFAYLDALDKLDIGRRSVPDSVLLAALLHPIYLSQTRGDEDAYYWLESLREESPILGSTKRKDIERMTQMFRAQRRFLREGRGRRFSTSGFVRKDYFVDSWLLFKLHSLATGEAQDVVEEWETRLQAGRARPPADVARPTEAPPAISAEGPVRAGRGTPRGAPRIVAVAQPEGDAAADPTAPRRRRRRRSRWGRRRGAEQGPPTGGPQG